MTEVIAQPISGAGAERGRGGLPGSLPVGLRAAVHHCGSPPVENIEGMIRSLGDQSLLGRRRSSELAVHLQYDVANHTPPPQISSLVQQVRHLIQDGLADPALSATGIAQQ